MRRHKSLIWGTLSRVPAKFVSPFQPGELIVHATHGLSRYAGTRLVRADDGTTSEYFQLDYAEGDRVFVPVEHVDRLSRHLGEDVDLARLTAGVERRTPYSRLQKPATTQ
jgi:transcription-repair coupling factor (superfamily II helicase)